MENRPVYAYIPPNLSSTGGLLGGMLDTRHVIEGIIGAGLAFAIYLMLRPFIGGAILFYICAGVGLALLIVGLLGVNGEPFSIFLFNIANYEQRRIFVTLRPPMPELNAKKKKYAQEQEEENKLLKILRRNNASANREDSGV